MRFDRFVEEALSPLSSAIIGSAITMVYLFRDSLLLDGLYVLIPPFVVYGIFWMILRSTRFRNENKLYTIPAIPALLVFLAMSFFAEIPRVFILATMSMIPIFFLVYFLRPRWKISAHMMFFMMVVGVLYSLDVVLGWLVLLAPLVAWSRLSLKRHNYTQLMIGSAVGITIPLFVNFFVLA